MCVLFLIFITVQIFSTDSARILAIIPTAFYSHQRPFQPLWRELSLRGHQVTLVTTDPMNDPTLTNLTELDMGYTYEIGRKYNWLEVVSDDSKSSLEILSTIRKVLEEVFHYQINTPELQNLIHNKSISFDLVIVEAQTPAMMAFSWVFKCPMIGVASLDAAMQYHVAMGNPIHPVVNPDCNLGITDPENMSFKERLSSFIYMTVYRYIMLDVIYPLARERNKKYFGDDLPSYTELQNNMSILFVYTNPIFNEIRALNPNTIPIGGGMHIKKPRPLPKELQNYLDNAKEGVIYFSMGTNVNGQLIKERIQDILAAFSEVPYQVLLKTDLELETVPKNVKAEKWFPQQDVLRHPNIKLFITQGGLQSLQEAVLNAVPLIGIPFFGDQIANVNVMVRKGYGIKLNKKEITKTSLKDSILEVMNNPKYRETAKTMSEIFKDEEVPSLERAIWWIEYVLRHKGAVHLRSPVSQMPLWKYLMLDVMGFISIVIFLIAFVLYKLAKFVFRKIVKRIRTGKVKVQ